MKKRYKIVIVDPVKDNYVRTMDNGQGVNYLLARSLVG